MPDVHDKAIYSKATVLESDSLEMKKYLGSVLTSGHTGDSVFKTQSCQYKDTGSVLAVF